MQNKIFKMTEDLRREKCERERIEKQLKTQYAVTEVLTEALTLAEATPRILQVFCENLDWDIGSIWYVHQDENLIRCGDMWHIPSRNFPNFEAMTRRSALSLGVGLPGRIWASGQLCLIKDVMDEPNFPQLKGAILDGIHSGFGFPVQLGNEFIGVIEFFSTQIKAMDQDSEFMKAIAGQIGQFISRKWAQEKAMDAVKTKSEFTSMVSHELRTPLTVIKGGIDVVLDEVVGSINPEQKDILDTVKKNIDRLSRLINNVLDFQKLESGRMEFHWERNEICKLIKDTVDDFIPVAAAKGLKLTCHMNGETINVKCDKDKITQVLINLINNAIKFTERGGINVCATLEGANVAVSVEDDGPGIKPEDLTKLFHSFTQIAGLDNRKTGGTGLGLAISKRIVENHHGRIEVTSEFGKGTTFTFFLPVLEDD